MDRNPLFVRFLLAAGILFLLIHFGMEAHAQYRQIPGAIDLRTTFSDGEYSVAGLAALAKEKGLQVLVINDHDQLCLEYGLPPFRNILKKRVELNSIIRSGAENYLQAIREAEKRDPEMIIIPGTESAPFYYWGGSPFNGTLTAYNHERRILTIGLEKPEAYRDLPLVHNDSAGGRLDLFRDGFIFFPAVILLGIAFLWWSGFYRWTGLAAIVISVFFLFNARPFKTSPFDPYHGDQGMAPYQYFIDHVRSEGGLTFWNYPETRSGVRRMGPIALKTLPYPGVILDSRNYTGFAALYGENVTLIEPGGLWDQTLIEYCRGFREKPPWAIATGDFHRESREIRLGNYYTVFLVRQKTKADVLAALRTGKMYAAQGRFPHVPVMEEFLVTGGEPGRTAVSGDEIVLKGKPKVRVSISGDGIRNRQVLVRLIRNGFVVNTYSGTLPARIEFEDQTEIKPGEMAYYRADVKGDGRIVTNPIFIRNSLKSNP